VSSVPLGIGLLTLLFIYMTVGSAGILYPVHPNIFHPGAWTHAQVRSWRPFEMTEFEWFHWWPFNLLLSLLAMTVVLTTLRRIPLKPVNFGVWMIHSGVLTLMIGCVIYFGTKVEGDAIVPRRRVVAEVFAPGADGKPAVVDRIAFVASPGQRVSVGNAEKRYELEVVSIDPDWEMRSEESAGINAYSVNVQVRSAPTPAAPGETFVRQLLAGHPENTEDIVLGTDPAQPMQRAVKALGRALVDESISLRLEYEPQTWMYLRPELEKCWALYVRRPGEQTWTQRRIAAKDGVPLYNDYVAARDQVFEAPGQPPLVPGVIDVAVLPAKDDPFPDLTLRITGYLRYAVERSEYRRGDPTSPINPVLAVAISGPDGEVRRLELEALRRSPSGPDAEPIAFRFAATESEFARLAQPRSLRIRVSALGIDKVEPIRELARGKPDAPFIAVAAADGSETGYAYRVVAIQDDLVLSTGRAGVAILEVRTPNGSFRRWVFDTPALTRDATDDATRDAHAASSIADPSIDISYDPGRGDALVVVVAGPEPNRLRVISALGAADANVRESKVGETIRFPAGITLVLEAFDLRAVRETRPFVVPLAQRERDVGVQLAKVLVDVPGASPRWLPYHSYIFDSPLGVLRRQTYNPTTFTLADGRQLEIMFGRQRVPLSFEVALDEFKLLTHVGGFSGEQGAIRDYMSLVRFRDADQLPSGTWSEPVTVSVNQPVEHRGLSFFQAFWDPPDRARFEGDRASLGLNYTVLGVANRNGVGTMLAGCCIAVAGMMFAFYVKPMIKRRKRDAVLASLDTLTAQAKEKRSHATSSVAHVAQEKLS